MTEPVYLPRSWWANDGWRRGGAELVDDDLWRLGNVCHYPGRASDFGIMSAANLRANLRGWWDYHVNGRGWSDIGYQVCVAMTDEYGPVVVDLRGIGRVPAAHASTSNPRANWHGGATLWVVGNNEEPHPDMVNAYRHFRHNVWLERWPTATGVTGHGRVPGASTRCPGPEILDLVDSGELLEPPEDDMNTPREIHNGTWRQDIMPAPIPYEDSENDQWMPESILRGGYRWGYQGAHDIRGQVIPMLEQLIAKGGGRDEVLADVQTRLVETQTQLDALAGGQDTIRQMLAAVDAGHTTPEEFVQRVGEILTAQ